MKQELNMQYITFDGQVYMAMMPAAQEGGETIHIPLNKIWLKMNEKDDPNNVAVPTYEEWLKMFADPSVMKEITDYISKNMSKDFFKALLGDDLETAETIEIQTVDLDDIVLKSDLALGGTGGTGSIGKQIDAKIKVVDDKVLTEHNSLEDFKTKTEQQIKDLSVAQINGGLTTDTRLTAIEKKQKDDEAEDVLLQAEITGIRTSVGNKVDKVDYQVDKTALATAQAAQDAKITALEAKASGGFKGNYDKATIGDLITPKAGDFAYYKIAATGDTTVLGTTVAYDKDKPWIRLEPTGSPLAWKVVSPLTYLATHPFNNLTAAEVAALIKVEEDKLKDRMQFVEDDIALINDDITDVKGELFKAALKTDVTEVQANLDDAKADILDVRATADDAITDKQNNLKTSTLDALGINADSSVKQPLATEDDFVKPFTKGLEDELHDATDVAFDAHDAKVVKSDNTEGKVGQMDGTGATDDAKAEKKLVSKAYVDKKTSDLKVLNSEEVIVDLDTMTSADGDTAADADKRLVSQQYVDDSLASLAGKIPTSSGGGSVKYIDIKTGTVKDHIKKLKTYKDSFAKIMFHRNVADVSRLGTVHTGTRTVELNGRSGYAAVVVLDNYNIMLFNTRGYVSISGKTLPYSSVKSATNIFGGTFEVKKAVLLNNGKVMVSFSDGGVAIVNEDGTISKTKTATLDNGIDTMTLLQDGKVFLGDEGGNAIILNEDGSVFKAKWKTPVSTIISLVTLQDGKVFAGTYAGKGIIFTPDGSVFKSSFTVMSKPLWNAVLLKNGKVYVGDNSQPSAIVNPDGTIFKSEWNAGGTDDAVTVLQDGEIFIGSKILHEDGTHAKDVSFSWTHKGAITASDGNILSFDSDGNALVILGVKSQHDHEDVISWNEDSGKVWIINGGTGVNEDIGSVTLDNTHTLSIQYMDETKGVITDVETTTTRRRK